MVTLLRKPINISLLLLFILALVSSFWILNHQWHLPWSSLFLDSDLLSIDALIVQNNTLPRMFMAILAGGSLAVATLLLQQVMNNNLASDSTLAVNSGAQMALVIATVFTPGLLIYESGLIAFLGAIFALLLVLWLSSKQQLAPIIVVLSGLVMALYLGSISGIITLFYSEETLGIMLWGSGSLLQDSWQDSINLLIRIFVSLSLIFIFSKPLTIMSLTDTQAKSLGIPVKTVRILSLSIAAFLCASVVSMVGMMEFVGLAAVTLVREFGVRTFKAKLLLSFIFGSLILLITDNSLVLLNIYYRINLPAGSVTAILGAPLLLWLLSRLPKFSENHKEVAQAVSRLRKLPNRFIILSISISVILAALFVGRSDAGFELSTAFIDLRYPRVLTAGACGIIIAITGALLQRLTQNPMASPELLGISSGTALGIMTGVLIFDVTSGSGPFWIIGVISALITLSIIMLLSRKSNMQPEKVLLIGVVMGALSNSFIRIWLASGDFRIQQLLIWISGSTYQTSHHLAITVSIIAIIALLITLPLQRWLGLISLNGIVAQSVGVNVKKVRIVLIIISAIFTGLSTLIIGPLSFIGLLAPHLANMLGARLPNQQLVLSAVIGFIIMILSDWLGRQIGFPYEIPAGLVASLIGGAYFLYVIRKF